jgi:hypothetical protein
VAGSSSALDEVLDAEFALELHRRALARVEQLWQRKGTPERFRALQARILGSEDRAYDQLATALGLTANHVKKIVFDLREAYYESFRDEVAQTVQDRQTLDEEMRYLIGLLARTHVVGS